ncbi:MAG: hypothetical protein AB1779_08450 [Candidatus Thermoplasmatota archaeon]
MRLGLMLLSIFILMVGLVCFGSSSIKNEIDNYNDIFIEYVGYGHIGMVDGNKVIFPEYIKLKNKGVRTLNISGLYITDYTEGGKKRWIGEALLKFPEGAYMKPGESIIIANYRSPTNAQLEKGYISISFKDAYGFEPDFEVQDKDKNIKDMIVVKGIFKLANYSDDRDQDHIFLINKSKLSDDELIKNLEDGKLPQEIIIDYY